MKLLLPYEKQQYNMIIIIQASVFKMSVSPIILIIKTITLPSILHFLKKSYIIFFHFKLNLLINFKNRKIV